jgi:hypothetical protein
MKGTVLVFVLAALAAPAAVAEQPGGPPDEVMRVERADLTLRELSSLLQTRETEKLGDLEVRDVRDLLAEASVRMQEIQLLTDVRRASLWMPGAGHMKAGDRKAGAGYLAANLALTAGTLVGAYFLLPSEVRFDELDYFGDSFGEIETAWKSQSFLDVLPSVGVLAGGFAVRAILGHFAAESAGRIAAARIRDGEIRFEPYAAADRLGIGATWRR